MSTSETKEGICLSHKKESQTQREGDVEAAGFTLHSTGASRGLLAARGCFWRWRHRSEHSRPDCCPHGADSSPEEKMHMRLERKASINSHGEPVDP